ncbi:MAG TPA: response regulator [Pyrinomonadaceae bacterium]|nr:response regulator [Pyrinomonadaceae bacterium]
MTTKARLLLVDDHPDSLEVLSLILEQSNFEVVGTDNGKQALRLTREEKFDAYILDSWLPDISGLDLCRSIREFDSHTPIVFYSANALDSDIDEAIQGGAQAYVVKPASGDEVIEAVCKVLDEKRNASAAAAAS